jgi:hypothetical protein
MMGGVMLYEPAVRVRETLDENLIELCIVDIYATIAIDPTGTQDTHNV